MNADYIPVMTKVHVGGRIIRDKRHGALVPEDSPDIEDFQWNEGKDGRKIVFGIDRDDNLYVNRKRVLVYEGLRFTFWQKVAGVFAIATAFIAAVASAFDAVVGNWDWLMERL